MFFISEDPRDTYKAKRQLSAFQKTIKGSGKCFLISSAPPDEPKQYGFSSWSKHTTLTVFKSEKIQ